MFLPADPSNSDSIAASFTELLRCLRANIQEAPNIHTDLLPKGLEATKLYEGLLKRDSSVFRDFSLQVAHMQRSGILRERDLDDVLDLADQCISASFAP